jgi:hypothetical protein
MLSQTFPYICTMKLRNVVTIEEGIRVFVELFWSEHEQNVLVNSTVGS